MQLFNQFPLVRLIIPFMLGIIIAIQLNTSIHIPLFFILFLLSFFVILFIFYKKISFRFRWLNGFFIYLLLILTGYEITLQSNSSLKTDFFGKSISKNNFVIATIISPCEIKPNSIKFYVHVEQIIKNKWVNTSGKALMYLEKKENSSFPKTGDRIIFKSFFNAIPPPQNPHEFNYKKYLAFKNIYFQTFVKADDYRILQHNCGNIILNFAAELQKKISSIFANSTMSKEEYAIASALIIGDRDYLDKDIYRIYSNTGVIHILSVSGLHVGIIYLFLNYLLFFLDKFKNGRYIKSFLIIGLIWFYALITGMSPPVLRAATMISFIIVGKMMNRSINTYNTLAASAFLILIIDPFIIADAGFQLSYLAVIGIVMFYDSIYVLWLTRNYILDQIWKLVAVSLAAQILTFPLALYYFHQFPNYFIFTNLFAIPLSSLIMYVGMLMIVFYPFKWMFNILTYILYFLIKLMNVSLQFFSDLPYSTIHHIFMNLHETILLFLIIVFLSVYIFRIQKKFMFLTLTCSILLAVSINMRHYNNFKQQKFIVYNIQNHSIYDFIDGQKSLLLTDSMKLNKQINFSFHIQPNHIACGIQKETELPFNYSNYKEEHIFKYANFIQINKNKIVFIDTTYHYHSDSGKINIDYLIIRQNPKINIEQLCSTFHPRQIIFDPSNSLANIKRWKADCLQLNISFHSVREQGYWEI